MNEIRVDQLFRHSFNLDFSLDFSIGSILDEFEVEKEYQAEMKNSCQIQEEVFDAKERKELLKFLCLVNNERKELRDILIKTTEKLMFHEHFLVIGINPKSVEDPMEHLRKTQRINSSLLSFFVEKKTAEVEALKEKLEKFKMRPSPEQLKELEKELEGTRKKLSEVEHEKEKLATEVALLKSKNERLRRAVEAMALAEPTLPMSEQFVNAPYTSKLVSQENLESMEAHGAHLSLFKGIGPF